MDGVPDCPHQDPELVPPIDRLLLQAQDDRAQILVIGKVVPVLRPVEIFLVCLLQFNEVKLSHLSHSCPTDLHNAGELEASVLCPVLLYDGPLPAGLLYQGKTRISLQSQFFLLQTHCSQSNERKSSLFSSGPRAESLQSRRDNSRITDSAAHVNPEHALDW